jgi:glutathione synthase/RimK-type ligase-like ATP-grasp enzyme
MLDVALVTCTRVPEGDVDDHLLAGALTRLGLSVAFVCWDDPDASWPAAGVVVVRSTWDYHERLDAFLGWAEYVGSVTTLCNDAATIRWNSHKGYLLDLADHGVDIVDTRVVRSGDHAELGPGDLVVKPAVSAGADRTIRFASQADLDALTATDDVLIQPYITAIETKGELSIVCIDGEVSHVVRKVPPDGDFRTQEEHGAAISVEGLDDRHRDLATAALSALDTAPLYARVDAADTEEGLQIMELELIEPTLWLRWHPPAADVLAASIAAQLTQSP